MDMDLKQLWQEFADELGQAGIDIISDTSFVINEGVIFDRRVIAIMLMSRTLSNFKGIPMLIERGLIVEARVLVRCCFENLIWLAGLISGGDKFIAKIKSNETQRAKSLGELSLAYNNIDEHVILIGKLLRNIKLKSRDGRTINPKDISNDANFRDAYIYYSILSSDSGHPSIKSLKRYIAQCAIGKEMKIDLAPKVNYAEVIQTLNWACYAMLGVCIAVNEVLEGKPAGQRLQGATERYLALRLRTGASLSQ
jgi:hypothetical protein